MRLPSPRFLVGLGTVVVVCLSMAVLWTRTAGSDNGGDGDATTPLTLRCLGGSEKTEMMADPTLIRLLKERYHLTVDFTPLGSYDQVQLSAEELKAKKVDCLWPSSSSAQSVFEAQHQNAFPDYVAENVLQSPEVVYAGTRGTDALVKTGIVQRRGDRYFIVDMKALLLKQVLPRRTWESLNAADLRGPVTIASTDPVKSNSGLTLFQLELSIVATSDAFSAPSLAQARQALPTVRAIYDAQGLQARTSDSGFREWLTQGGEFKSPLFAGYENQIIQQAVRAGDGRASLRDNVRVLYPEPTIYSDHPVLALNRDAARLIEAMKDTEVQELAWHTFGFRSAVRVGLAAAGDFSDLSLADQIRATPPPAADVTLALLSCLRDAKTCQ